MPSPTSRCHLESGLKLNLNNLARRGFIRPGAAIGPVCIQWTNSYWGALATGNITADLRGEVEGWFRIQIGDELDQRIILVTSNPLITPSMKRENRKATARRFRTP